MRPYKPTSDGYTTNNITVAPNKRMETAVSYTGNGGSLLPKPASYDADYNASISANRATEGRFEVGSSNLFSGHIAQTTHNTRQHRPNMGVAGSSYLPVPPTAKLCETRTPQSYDQLNRNTSDILDAFKQNPYTHSLQSVA